MESLTQVIGRIIESMEDFSSWEEEVHSLSLEASQKLAREFLKAVDDELAKNREKDLTVVGKRKMTLMTKFGCVEVERRLYMDGNGNYRYLLDEAIGLKNCSGTFLTCSL